MLHSPKPQPAREPVVPTRGTPGGHRDAWDELDPAVIAMQDEQAALEAAIAAEVELREAEQPGRAGRSRKPRSGRNH